MAAIKPPLSSSDSAVTACTVVLDNTFETAGDDGEGDDGEGGGGEGEGGGGEGNGGGGEGEGGDGGGADTGGACLSLRPIAWSSSRKRVA